MIIGKIGWGCSKENIDYDYFLDELEEIKDYMELDGYRIGYSDNYDHIVVTYKGGDIHCEYEIIWECNREKNEFIKWFKKEFDF